MNIPDFLWNNELQGGVIQSWVCVGSKCASCATYLLRAHGVHSWHLQRAHLHLTHHRAHVLDVSVPTCHGHGDAHVVVHSRLCRRGLVLYSLTEYTVNSKRISITSTDHEDGDNMTGLYLNYQIQDSKGNILHS